MKINKLAAISLCVATLSSKALACTLSADANPNLLEERQNEVFMFLAVSLFFAVATFFLYFKKNKEGIIPVIASFLVVGYTILTASVFHGDCGGSALYNAKIGISITFVCFLAQFFTWLIFRKKSHAELS